MSAEPIERTRVDAPTLSGRAGPADHLSTLALSDGTVLAVHEQGPPDAATTVVLVHGWTQDHTSWADVLDELAAHHDHLRVVAYDARGHGHSDAGPRETATIEQLADDLAEVLLGLVPDGPVVVAGHSLGGPVIMAFAQRHRELLRRQVAGVALVATSAAGLGRDIFGWSSRLTTPAMLAQPIITRIRAWSRSPVNARHPSWLAEVLRLGLYGPGAATKRNRMRTAAQVARSHPATTAALVDEMLAHDRLEHLHDLDATPTVVLAGTKDGLCPMAHSRAIAAAMPNAELVVFPKAGHMLPYERPAEVAEHLARLAGGMRPAGGRRRQADAAPRD